MFPNRNSFKIITQNNKDRDSVDRLAKLKDEIIPGLKETVEETEDIVTQHSKSAYLGIMSKFNSKYIEKLKQKCEDINLQLNKFSNNTIFSPTFKRSPNSLPGVIYST